MKYRFYKTHCPITGDGEWFIDLKWFPFNKAWLQMVEGADDILDILADGEKEVTLEISSFGPIPGYNGILNRVDKNLVGGAIYETEGGYDRNTYLSKSIDAIDFVWLCPATLWVFWKYPKRIYFKREGLWQV